MCLLQMQRQCYAGASEELQRDFDKCYNQLHGQPISNRVARFLEWVRSMRLSHLQSDVSASSPIGIEIGSHEWMNERTEDNDRSSMDIAPPWSSAGSWGMDDGAG